MLPELNTSPDDDTSPFPGYLVMLAQIHSLTTVVAALERFGTKNCPGVGIFGFVMCKFEEALANRAMREREPEQQT